MTRKKRAPLTAISGAQRKTSKGNPTLSTECTEIQASGEKARKSLPHALSPEERIEKSSWT